MARSDGVTGHALGRAARGGTAERTAARQPRMTPVRSVVGLWKTAEQFIREVIVEMKRVSWPERPMLIASSLVVVFVLTVTALYLAGCDVVFGRIFQSLVSN
jgi:preprotein translocase subunit SecE